MAINWSRRGDDGIVCVVGKDISTQDFPTDADLELKYVEAVKRRFDKHKVNVRGERYADRTIKWIETKSH